MPSIEMSHWEWLARYHEPHPRQWARPGDLARALDPTTGTSPALELIDDELVALADHQNPADALAIFIAPGEGKPVTISAMILMADGSRKQLSNIEPGDAVITHQGRPGIVRAVHDQGVLPAVKITTHAGRVVTAALDHPFLTPSGWTEAGKLRLRDALAVVTTPQIEASATLTAEAARLMGYFVGDGNTTLSHHAKYNPSVNAVITCVDPVEYQDIEDCAAALGFAVRNRRPAVADPEHWSVPRAAMLSKGVRPWLRLHGLAGCNSHTKRVPAEVFTQPPGIIAEFIGAYFACDGTVSRRGGARLDARLEFNSVSRDLLSDVQHLLLRLGIGSTIRPRTATYKGKPHLSWRLLLRRQDDVCRFRDAIPVHHAKAQTLAEWPLRREAFDAPLMPDPIEKIEQTEAECRCLTVPGDESFTAEDLAVHNSQRVSRRFPEWLLAHNPRLRIAVVSYEQEMATRWGRQILRDLKHADPKIMNVQVMADSSAAGRWDTPEGGGLYCVGVGGALTGRPVDVLLLDDPVKDRESAESETYRNRAWDWWESVALTRLAPGAVVAFVMCIVAGMRVLTGNGRWTPVEDIRPGDTVVSLDEARTGLRTAKVTAARLSGTDPTFRVETDRLALEVNGRHPFAVVRQPRRKASAANVEWVPAADLKPGDVVVTAKSLPNDYQAADVLPDGSPVDEERAWLLGYLTGDGWVAMYQRVNQPRARDGGIPISYGVCCAKTKSDKPWKADLDDKLLAALGAWSPNRVYDTGYGYWRTDWNDGGRLLEIMGYRAGAARKRVPACVWNWSPPLRRAYLMGYAEADGGLVQPPRSGGPVWMITSASVELLNDVRDLALTCGVRPTSVYTGAARVYQPPNSPTPVTSVPHSLRLTFCPDHAEGRSHVGIHPDPAHLRYEKVTSVTPGPAKPVYDLTVEGSESFIAEGYAVHNTRWHEDDLAGRILSRPSPLRWRILSLPAIAGDDDPLDRLPGEELKSVRNREPGHFAKIRAGTSAYVFSSLYQQSPTAAEGNFFRRNAFRYWRPISGLPDPGVLLAGGCLAGAWLELEGLRVDLADPAVWRFATCDVAASVKTASDFTAICVWAIDREGDLILLDMARGHVEMSDHFAMAKPLRSRWRFDVLYVEKSFFSKTMVVDARTAGVPVAEVVADSDKVSRAIPAAGRMHSGKIWFPANAPWLTEWENEIASFPAGAHDDMVDCLSYAARIAAAHWTPAPPPSRPPSVPKDLAEIERAFNAATGDSSGHTDLMNRPLG